MHFTVRLPTDEPLHVWDWAECLNENWFLSLVDARTKVEAW
jgi:hypothetical protein